MKKILIASVLAVAVASPALAASKQRHRNVVVAPTAQSSYAFVPASAPVVVSGGQVLGADPDPFIRGQLLREGDPGSLNN